MRLTRVVSISLAVILFLGIAGGTLWLLDFLAVLDLNKSLAKIPVVNKFIYPPSDQTAFIKKPLKIEKTPAEKENDILKKEKQELKTANDRLVSQIEQVKQEQSTLAKQLEVIKKEKQILIAERDNLNKALETLQQSQPGDETREISYKKLAKIYAEMKPQAAVKIMENLTDEVVIGILLQLEDDQVAKILTAMNPQKAAILVDSMKD